MSGLISSFLVEPLRRRLSHQPSVPSSPVEPNQAESPPNPREAAFRLNRHDNIDFGVAPGERYSRIGQSSRHADLALGSQCLQDEDSFQSGQNKDEYRQDGALIDIPAQGEVFGHPVNSAAPIVGHDGGADSGLPPENGFEMYEIGAQLALPEDDGMGKLRARIHAIRDLDVTGPQKAYLIHNVMTERYYTSRGGSASHSRPTESSPPDLRNLEQSGVPNYGAEERQDQFSMNPASTTTIIQQSNPYNLTREDLAPTYFPKADQDPQACDGEDIETEEFEEACLGCEHYKRNVKLQCYTCKKWYTCRFCHDAVEDHHLIRRETENMLCMLCGHAQPAAQWCIECGEQTAQYHCGVCKLWDNDSKKTIYHCNDCGICRIGQGLGKDFFHCRVGTSRRGSCSDAKPKIDLQRMLTDLD